MNQQIELTELDTKIQLMKRTAQELSQIADQFPAVARNTVRILASIKMLEINVSDVIDVNLPSP